MDLITVEGSTIRVVRTLTEDEHALYISAARVLGDAERSFYAMAMVDRNQEEFFTQLDKSTAEYLRDSLEARSLNRYAFRANWQLINYLASMRFFLDYTETRVKRRFGKSSAQSEKFKRACSSAFDSKFAYRFLYKLRNYAQHCGLPAGPVDVRGQPSPEGKPFEIELTVYFDPIQLLKEYRDWGLVKQDLQRMSAPFSVSPLIREITTRLHKIHVLTVAFDLPELKKAGRQVLQVINDALGTAGVPALGQMITDGPEGEGFEIFWPPLRMLQHLNLLKYE